MKLRTLCLIGFVASWSLLGCDPPHSIEFVNESSSQARVLIKLDTTTENYDLNYLKHRQGDSLFMVLETNESATLHYGIGTWHIDEIKHQVGSFKWITIENKDQKRVWKSKMAMEKLLKEHRVKAVGWTTKIVIPIE